MLERRIIISVLILTNTFLSYCQGTKLKEIPDSLFLFDVGIYLNVDEFLNNKPGITYFGKRIGYNSSYFLYPGDRDNYLIEFYDTIGNKITLSMDKIWGFYDGNNFYISHFGKPYELMDFGPVSRFLFRQHYNQSQVTQALDIFSGKTPNSNVNYIDEFYYDFENKTFFSFSEKKFEMRISKDKELYDEYMEAKRMKKGIIKSNYIKKYNKRNPLKITTSGIFTK